jgi:hypothetical protein
MAPGAARRNVIVLLGYLFGLSVVASIVMRLA